MNKKLWTSFVMSFLVVQPVMSKGIQEAYKNVHKIGYELGRVHAGLITVERFKTECDARYPEMTETNDRAHEAWEQRNKKIIKDVDRLMNISATAVSRQENMTFKEAHELMLGDTSGLDEHMAKYIDMTGDNLKAFCADYESYTQSALADIKLFDPTAVKTLYDFIEKYLE